MTRAASPFRGWELPAGRALHSVEGSCRNTVESPFLGRLGSCAPSTVSAHRDVTRQGERELGICGRTRRALARRLVALTVATVLAALFVGVSWGAAYAPETDPYSQANVTLGTGAQAWWNAGYTGK